MTKNELLAQSSVRNYQGSFVWYEYQGLVVKCKVNECWFDRLIWI